LIYARSSAGQTRFSLFLYYLIVNLPILLAITMRSFFERIPYTLEEAA
jgi:ABC-type glycerol-3-phosphate transport system permease component